MAEIKNNFLKAKMNKDLDARLIPNGQYRDAQNIVISRSEGDSVGTVQNILGNSSLTDFGLDDKHLEVIGFYVNELREEIYLFITNYSDTSSDNISNHAPSAAKCGIYCYQKRTNSYFTLCQGHFLNFSKTHIITGVDLIENLLFWTDNRNQPRQLNIETAISNSLYYKTEDHISIAKYYPHNPIRLYKEEVSGLTISNAGNTGDYSSIVGSLPYELTASQVIGGSGQGLTLTITALTTGPQAGKLAAVEITNPGVGYTNGDVIQVDPRIGSGEVTLTVAGISTMKNKSYAFLPPKANGGTNPNPDYDVNWPGDAEFLKDKFVRFSYRFKFVDGEYSLMAPFTQAAFIPNNDGYFLDKSYNPTTGQIITGPVSELDKSFQSTTNPLMSNKVEEIGLMLEVPKFLGLSGNDGWSSALNDLKIQEIDIIYQEDGSTTLHVLDTITNEQLAATTIDLYQYNYQSRKPVRVLPDFEYTRVSDKVPVRAKGLSTAGNRLIFSNFYNKHTSPSQLEYNSAVQLKDQTTTIEYQNHTLKQNRNYQVGIVLSDRYGRQSDVILSSVDDGVIQGIAQPTKGSTLFNDYRKPNEPLDVPAATWGGEFLNVVWKQAVPEVINSPGYPGLYSLSNPLGWYSYKIVVKQNQQEYYNVYLPSIMNSYPNNPTFEVNETAHISLFADNINKVPKDLVDVGPEAKIFRSSVDLWGRVTNTNIYNSGSAQFYPTTNPDFVNTIGTIEDLNIGQTSIQQQNNTYTIGNASPNTSFLLDGRIPSGPKNGIVIGSRVTAVDVNGNVLFKNSELVDYIYTTDAVTNAAKTKIIISPAYVNNTGGPIPANSKFTFDVSPFYNSADNPLIGRISTIPSNLDTFATKNIGEQVDFSVAPTSNDEDFFPIRLAVYETKPVESNLEIFYETSTSGLISELNTEITSGDTDTPYGFSDPDVQWFENEGANAFVTGNIYPVDAAGNNIIDVNANFVLDSVTYPAQQNQPVPNWFTLVNNQNGSFTIKTNNTQAVEGIFYGQGNAMGMETIRFTITANVNTYYSNTSFIDVNLSNIIPSWVYSVYPATTFQWTSGPKYPVQNNPVYLGSLLSYGFYGSSLSSPWSGSSYTGKINGQVTNGSFIPNQSGNQTRELSITNVGAYRLSYSNCSQTPPSYLAPQYGNLNVVQGLAGTSGGLDPNDLSSTGLGFTTIVNPVPSDQSDPNGASVSYRLLFTLTDGGGLSVDYEVKFFLQNY